MSNSVKAATVSYNVNKYVDSLSNTYGSGSSLCGPIVYTVSGAYSSTVTWMTYNFSSLQLLFYVRTNLDSDIKYTPSGYAVTIRGCLSQYPTVCSAT
jgi:hypothetical protein